MERVVANREFKSMNTMRLRTLISPIAIFVCLISFSTLSIADPYSITYSGIISDNLFPEVNNGEAYTATLVFDNGAASAESQTWEAADLTCAIFTMNDAENIQFSHDLTLQNALDVSGNAATDGSGVLSANFTEVDATPVDEGSYTSNGIVLVPPLNWYMNDNNNVFHSTGHSVDFGDAAGGVQMAPVNWTNPVPYLGDCYVSEEMVTSGIPTLDNLGLMMLILVLTGFGLVAIRRT